MLHCVVIYSLGSITQSSGYTEDLPSSTLLVLLLVIFGQLLKYLDLRRFDLLFAESVYLSSASLLLNELAIFIQKVLDNQILDYTLHVLDIIIV